MITLRRTQKLRAFLPLAGPSGPSDAALGDWYVNRIVVDRKPLLLLVSSASLLPILVPARDVRTLPERLGEIVARRLRRMGVDAATVEAERAAMSPVHVGQTADRSVLGIMVEFAKMLPHHMTARRWEDAELQSAEDWLADTPCRASAPAGSTVFPVERTRELLSATWAGGAERPAPPPEPPAHPLALRRGKPARPPRTTMRFKVTLAEVEPPIWRRIEVPGSYRFWDLHVAIQDAMGWKDCHLHMFRVRDPVTGAIDEIGIPDDEPLIGEPVCLAGWKVRVTDYFKGAGTRATYEYDFGDCWMHEIELEGFGRYEVDGSYPCCLAGARACPPEDCGGPPGYASLLETMADPEHEEYEAMMDWLGGRFDPEYFSPERVEFDDPRVRWRVAFEDEA